MKAKTMKAFIGAFMAFMVLAFMTTFDGFLCFMARRRFMAFIGAACASAAFFFFIARFMAFMAAAFMALARIAFIAAFMAFFIAAAIVVRVVQVQGSRVYVEREALN